MRALIASAVLLGASLMAAAAVDGGSSVSSGQNLEKVTGNLVAFHTRMIKGDQDRHVLGALKTDDGKIIGVDFGSVKLLESKNLKLSWNDKISVEGFSGLLNDRNIIFAEKIIGSDGKLIALERPRVLQEETAIPTGFQRGMWKHEGESSESSSGSSEMSH